MEASSTSAPLGLGRTSRRDAWWLRPLLVVVGLTAFTIYSVLAIAQGSDYLYTEDGARYLSPFYSPDLSDLFGIDPPFSFAFLVVWAPLGLRLTCYYYRKAYYRSFFLAPPACAVAGPARRRYRGETRFPFVLQNAHRYFLYAAIVVLGFLWYDAGRAFFFTGSDGRSSSDSASGRSSSRQRPAALALHLRLQLAAPPRRREPRLLQLLRVGATRALARRVPAQPQPRGVGLDQPRGRRPRRPLRPAGLSGRLRRPAGSSEWRRWTAWRRTSTTCS